MLHLKIAGEEDLEDIHRLSMDFFRASPYKDEVISEDKVRATVNAFINGNKLEKIILLLHTGEKSVGILAALSSENLFNDERITCEVMWWIDPEYRGLKNATKLLDAYEYWAINKVKARYIQMVSLDDEAVNRWYKRRGFNRVENSYVKMV